MSWARWAEAWRRTSARSSATELRFRRDRLLQVGQVLPRRFQFGEGFTGYPRILQRLQLLDESLPDLD